MIDHSLLHYPTVKQNILCSGIWYAKNTVGSHYQLLLALQEVLSDQWWEELRLTGKLL